MQEIASSLACFKDYAGALLWSSLKRQALSFAPKRVSGASQRRSARIRESLGGEQDERQPYEISSEQVQNLSPQGSQQQEIERTDCELDQNENEQEARQATGRRRVFRTERVQR